MSDKIKARLFVCGQDKGTIEISKDSLVGNLAAGSEQAALGSLGKMIEEINEIPNVKATVTVETT